MDNSGKEPGSLLEKIKKLSAEQWVLLFSIFAFLLFLWITVFLFLPLLSGRPIALPQVLVEAAATHGFVLPATWTPGPTVAVVATGVPTTVYDGTIPTRMYTPYPTSLPGLPMPIVEPRISVIDLARILQGESPGDKEAAYYVGWVAKNRLKHPGYGSTYAVVSHGFFGYKASIMPKKEFLDLAAKVIRDKHDPTGGCLYALSRTDITKLGVPPSRADVHVGEWFFFRTWPAGS